MVLTKESRDLEDNETEIERYMSDFILISDRLEELRKKYPGQYITVKEGKIVDSDKDLETLLRRLEEKGIDPSKTAIDYISEKPELLIV